jgi:flagellar motor switch/type III secretory pathway protein FliN
LPTGSGATPGHRAAVGDRAAGAAAQALVPAGPSQAVQAESALEESALEESVFPAPILRLPVDLAVSLPVREFRVRQLLALAPGQVVETQWSHGEDLPLASGDVQVAWSEFEVVESRLAVRITRLE